MDREVPNRRMLFEEAVQHLTFAIALLDQAKAPGHIAAHADLALNQLQDSIAAAEQPNTLPAGDDGLAGSAAKSPGWLN